MKEIQSIPERIAHWRSAIREGVSHVTHQYRSLNLYKIETDTGETITWEDEPLGQRKKEAGDPVLSIRQERKNRLRGDEWTFYRNLNPDGSVNREATRAAKGLNEILRRLGHRI